MNLQLRTVRFIATLLFPLAILACSEGVTETEFAEVAEAAATTFAVLDVYKDPTCGCCNLWVEHLEESGFRATVHHSDDLNQIKVEHGIAPRYQSCHTAVSQDGFVFEGHVPARYIKAFLQDPPADAIGLAVPGMPLGSPGMEVGDRFTPYQIWLLKADGSAEIFVAVDEASQQVEDAANL